MESVGGVGVVLFEAQMDREDKLRRFLGLKKTEYPGRLTTMNDTPLTPEQEKQAEANAAKDGYLHRDAVALDDAVNVLADGNLDETISARVRRVSDAHKGWSWNPGVWLAKGLNAGLNLIQKNHGAKAEAGDLQRAKKIEEIEKKSLGV